METVYTSNDIRYKVQDFLNGKRTEIFYGKAFPEQIMKGIEEAGLEVDNEEFLINEGWQCDWWLYYNVDVKGEDKKLCISGSKHYGDFKIEFLD